MTYAYHEVDPAQLDNILTYGIKRSSQGFKSKDTAITKTDKLLDKYCPENLQNSGVSRENNIYGYLVIDNEISDIMTGQLVKIPAFISKSQQGVVRLTIDTDYCYISDLDAYDSLKLAVTNGQSEEALQPLIQHYWSTLMPFAQFNRSAIKRPEVMITYDINPHDISVIKP